MKQYLRLLSYLYPYRLRLLAAFACALLVAGLSAAYAWLVRPVLDGLFISKDESLLLVLPVAILAVAVLKGVFNYGQNYLMNYVGNQVIGDIREQLFSKLVRLPVQFHDTNTSGRLVSRVINDVNQMANAVAGVLKDLFQQGLTFLAMIGVIIYQNWKLAMVSMIVVPLSVVTMARMGKKVAGSRNARAGAHGRHGLDAPGNVGRNPNGEIVRTGRRGSQAVSSEQRCVHSYDDEGDPGLVAGVLAHGSHRGAGGSGDHLVRRLSGDS